MSTITSLSVSSSPVITFRWDGTNETLSQPGPGTPPVIIPQQLALSTVSGHGAVADPGHLTLAGWNVSQFSQLVAATNPVFEVVLTPPAAGPDIAFQTGQLVTIEFSLTRNTITGEPLPAASFPAAAIVDAPYGQVINAISSAAAPGPGIKQDLDYLAGFPFQVYDSYATPSGGGGGGGGPAPSARAMVDAQMKAVLGRSTGTGGVAGTLAALDRSFQMVVADGVDTWAWQPRSYAVQSDIGAGVTGQQASLARLAASVGDEILPMISGLSPLVPEANVNPDEIAAAQTIFSQSWPAFTAELSTDGGPRITRAQGLLADAATQLVTLGILLGMYQSGTTLPLPPPAVVPRGRGIKLIRDFKPLDPATWPPPDRANGVVTADDEANYTNFIIAVDRVRLVVDQYQNVYPALAPLGPPTPPEDRGFLIVLLQRALDTVGESADAVFAALDSVNLGQDERETIYLLPGQPGSLSVEDAISWAADFPAQEAATLLQDAGNVGVASIAARAAELQTALTDVTGLGPPTAPPGLLHPRVTYALALLVQAIGEVTAISSNPSLGFEAPAAP